MVGANLRGKCPVSETFDFGPYAALKRSIGLLRSWFMLISCMKWFSAQSADL
jgi:hypothetical protein